MTGKTIIYCIFSFVAGIAVFWLVLYLMYLRRSKTTAQKRIVVETKKKKIKTMDVVLIVVGIALAVFTAEMVRIYRDFGTEPTTLETCVFAALGGECGIMGWIKTTKERAKEREWQQEDEKRYCARPPDDSTPTQ